MPRREGNCFPAWRREGASKIQLQRAWLGPYLGNDGDSHQGFAQINMEGERSPDHWHACDVRACHMSAELGDDFIPGRALWTLMDRPDPFHISPTPLAKVIFGPHLASQCPPAASSTQQPAGALCSHGWGRRHAGGVADCCIACLSWALLCLWGQGAGGMYRICLVIVRRNALRD